MELREIIHFPQIGTRLPIHVHPRVAEAEALLAEYVAGHPVLNRYAAKIRQDQSARLVCLWAPQSADMERILAAAKYVMITYLIDDMIDEGWTGIGAKEMVAGLKRVIAQEKRPETAVEETLAAIINPFLDGLGRTFRSRINAALGDWIDSRTTGSAPHETHRMTDEEFLAWRVSDVGYEANIGIAEYAVGCDVSGHEEALRALKVKAVEHVLVINDVYSYRRELAKGCAAASILTLWMRRDGISLQRAVYRACELVRAVEADYVAMESELVSGEPGMASYAEALRMLFQGNLVVHASGTRYNGAAFRGNLLRGAWVRLDPDITSVIAYDPGSEGVGEPVPLPPRRAGSFCRAR
ncbi:terpene synthase family protein [Streptomyces roseoverticillatus]|uniref:terpene synthase family protein n=1 Tax=Streptomyces roseoverticillatus TaxID=66429 RepID=UPI0004C196F1|nr:terpene synthase family protein [Streptomyces roseoverticillatus]